MNQHLKIIQGDILEFDGDAIVNPANIALKVAGDYAVKSLKQPGTKSLRKLVPK